MKSERELIIDVGSASVGAAFVERGAKGELTLSQVVRVPIGAGTTELRPRVEEALKTLLAGFHGAPAPKKARIVLGSPWYEARIRTIGSKAQKPVRVSTATVARAVKSSHAEGKAPFAEGRRRLESVVTEVYVNGYQSRLKKLVHGTSMEVELYESAADEGLASATEELVRGVFPAAHASFHSFPLVAFVVLRARCDEKGFMIIDVGGPVSDIAIVHADGLRFLASLPKGAATLSEASEPGRLSLYARGELSPEEAGTVGAAFTKAALAWNTDFAKVIEAAVSETPVPKTTFLIASPDELLWFGKVLEAGHDAFPARVIPITPNFFQSTVSLGEGATYDAALSIAALFFHTDKKELLEA